MAHKGNCYRKDSRPEDTERPFVPFVGHVASLNSLPIVSNLFFSTPRDLNILHLFFFR